MSAIAELLRPRDSSLFRRVKRWFGRAALGLAILVARVEARVLPGSWMRAMGRCSARCIVRWSRATREALFANGRRLLDEPVSDDRLRRFAVGVLTNFSRFFIEIVRAPRDYPSTERLLETMVGREHGERVLGLGRGAIGVTLHLGNYELASVLSERFRPAAVVYRPDPNGIFERLRSRTRQFAAVGEITTDRPLFGVEVMNLLRQRGAVFAAGDIAFEGEPSGVEVEFLGGVARFHDWPARVSVASGAPILPCFVVPSGDDGEFVVHLEPPILPEEHDGADAIVAKLLAIYERYVRAWPEHWLVVHRYWNEAT